MAGDAVWLPSDEDEAPPDPAARTAELRGFGRRALIVAVLWGLFAGSVFVGLIVYGHGMDPRPLVLSWILGLCLLTAAGFALLASLRWRRRHRAVLRTGWRAASVTVRPDYPVRTLRHLPDLLVDYRDGSRAELRASVSTHGSTYLWHQPGRPAWVGGSGPDMVVLFARGDRRRPYAVPAFGRRSRTEPNGR
ncbi:hypothetical protein [Amycolatopsis sp. Hca4]|uniref:hypothetical protein n=1 Tax=Amycolatopsis sp. Hca4 TaxID=2742131 RepID=UPI001590C64B|nr:hypothetical protein [Amycolatopsis sp. Hca4]QKV73870.1 hypothetical protein HUT10_08860 [Amycolatopsis sp. Hca4]